MQGDSERQRHIASQSYVYMIERLQRSQAATERECLGLHGALAEAIRRLVRLGQDSLDLKAALEDPSQAPITWTSVTRLMTEQQRSDEYERIYGHQT